MTGETTGAMAADRRHEAIAGICEAMAARRVFLIAGHKRPDGDCLGSQLAMRLALIALGKRAVCYNQGPIPEHYRFLPGIEEMRSSVSQDEWRRLAAPGGPGEQGAVATVFLDCSTPDRVAEEFEPHGAIVCVDHHATSYPQGGASLIDPGASATAELLYEVFEEAKVDITRDIATCLYAGILTDTGSFRFANTTARCMEIAARLIERGADPAAIATACYETREPQSLVLAGKVMSALRFEYGGTLVWGEITREMYEAAGGDKNEPENLASDLRAARGVRVAILFKHYEKGARVSLRSRAPADVAAFAERFGGGGHPRAAGIEMTGDYSQLRDRVLQAAREHIEKKVW